MIECEFIKQNLLVETYSGNVTVEDIIILKEYEFAHEKYNDAINILADLRSADFSCDTGDSIKIKEFFDANLLKMRYTRIAFLTEEIKLNTYSSFMKILEEYKDGIKIKLFTDEIEANNWLGEEIK